jgi:hypothetical protein
MRIACASPLEEERMLGYTIAEEGKMSFFLWINPK